MNTTVNGCWKDIKKNPEVQQLILSSQEGLDALGYTEHSFRHIGIVSKRAGDVLDALGYDSRRVELAKIAGYLHDIGNCVIKRCSYETYAYY